jgi:hypothetical protein
MIHFIRDTFHHLHNGLNIYWNDPYSYGFKIKISYGFYVRIFGIRYSRVTSKFHLINGVCDKRLLVE